MLRRAVIQHLKGAAPSLGGRVFQAFLAPANTPRPYATVKLADGGASPRISFAGAHLIEVRICDDYTSDFISLDAITDEVVRALHGKTVEDAETGEKYEVFWIPGMVDYAEADRKIIGRLVRFQAAAIF